MKKAKQLSLFPNTNNRVVHGGASTSGKRKIARPIAPRVWIHLCLKSSKAKGNLSFWNKKHKSKIENLIRSLAKKNFVELGDNVNMGNHFHLKIRVRRLSDFRKFLRSVSGIIARVVTGAKRGNKFGKFWDALAFTRMLKSTIEELYLRNYFKSNRIEREKGYASRNKVLDQFNLWVRSLKNTQSTG